MYDGEEEFWCVVKETGKRKEEQSYEEVHKRQKQAMYSISIVFDSQCVFLFPAFLSFQALSFPMCFFRSKPYGRCRPRTSHPGLWTRASTAWALTKHELIRQHCATDPSRVSRTSAHRPVVTKFQTCSNYET